MSKLFLVIATALLVAGGCSPGNAADGSAPSSNDADQSVRAEDAPPPGATARQHRDRLAS